MTLSISPTGTDMKKLFTTLVLIAAIFVVSFTSNKNRLPVGSMLPKAGDRMPDVSGALVSFTDALRPEGLLVMFSSNTCPYVIKNQQRTKEICTYALQKDIGVILINSNEGQREEADSFTAMQQYAREQGYSWYYVLDKNSVMADEFDANRTPECFLFNAEKKLVYHGAIDDNPIQPAAVKRSHLRLAMDEMLEGKNISVQESRSAGCAIKRIGD